MYPIKNKMIRRYFIMKLNRFYLEYQLKQKFMKNNRPPYRKLRGYAFDTSLSPSESNPQFHQQMVYAVTMTTIRNFERALGRKVIWASRRVLGLDYEEYVQRLRIYPHALREANAYYSPQKKALLFGYFSSTP